MRQFFIGVYGKVLKGLSLHKGFPHFCAHGGLHLVAFLVLFVLTICMGVYLNNSNVASFNQIVYTFYGDTLHNYRLNYLSFEKDMSRRPNNVYNENDIQLSYGYVRDTAVHNPKIIKPAKKGAYNPDCDLVSIVRYVTCDDSDGFMKKNECYHPVKGLPQLRKTEYVSGHDRYYYNLSLLNDSSHVYYRVTHAEDHLIEWGGLNPYFSFWIGIVMVNPNVELNDESIIRIKTNDIKAQNSSEGIEHPLIFDHISPTPTYSNINEIVYKGKELKNVIKQNGVYISGVDPVKRERVEKRNLAITVLLGTFIAIMLDVFVHLIIKWLKLKAN